VSNRIDKHITKAFASLDDLSKRELEATAEALGRRHPLGDFASVFREVAWSRGNDFEPRIARFHVREYVNRADSDIVELLAAAEAPFWVHVRDAVLACQEDRVA
jgi:hypothetical protein